MYKAQDLGTFPLKNSLIFKVFAFVFICHFQNALLAQTPFMGRLTYRVSALDSNVRSLVPADTFQVYTNDTIVRLESRTSLGQQVSIRHLQLNKSYILLYFKGEKLAIKTNIDSVSTQQDNQQNIRYLRWKKKKFGSFKAKRAIITREDLGGPKTIYYIPSIRPDLLNVYEGIKGLPAIYYLQHQEGVFKYELIDIDTTVPDHDRFGIPSDFEKITFDEFMDRFKPSPN